jgi:phospholipid/cholesterol/gamma-HCH transport system substrate-binding protein
VSYLVTYHNVTGLKSGAPVFYEGFRIGQVTGIDPVRGAEHTRYKIELSVRKDWPIPSDSIARLQSSGLLADVSIAIREGTAKDAAKPGSELKGEEGGDVFAAVNELANQITILARDRISPLVESLGKRFGSIAGVIDTNAPILMDQAHALLTKLDNAALSVNEVLSPQNRSQIDQTLANIRKVTADLHATQDRLDTLLDSLKGTAEENRPALRATIADLAQITSALAKRIDAISHNLESSSRNFNEFTREVRKSPNRLLVTPKADKVDPEKDQEK